jgi:hypothetical protein
MHAFCISHLFHLFIFSSRRMLCKYVCLKGLHLTFWAFCVSWQHIVVKEEQKQEQEQRTEIRRYAKE